MNSIHEYIFNDLKDLFIGKLNTTKENSNYYDIIDSPSCKIKDSNLIMIPKLIINKNNKRNNFNELLEVAYNKLKSNKKFSEINNNTNNNIYHEIFYFYKEKNTNNLATKIYTIFPNVNFEFKQIKNLSFSNTNLNKYLISSKFKLQENEKNEGQENNEYINGFFTMSQNHRLIALKDDLNECGRDVNKSQSLKEIIVGIWLNLKNEKPPPKKADLDFLFNKYKFLIYKECFRFIQLSNNIETIYSPSPEENIFLLVIFYKGMQCHYEVKIGVNNNEKKMYDNNNNNINIIKDNNWVISKGKYELDEQRLKIPFDYDIKIEINNGTVSTTTMTDYLNKKNKNKNFSKKNEINKETIKDNNNTNERKIILKENKEIKNNNNEENNNNLINNTSSDVFDVSDYEGDNSYGYGGYNYPLAIPNINKNNSNNNLIKNNQNKNEQNILYKKQQHETSRASTNAHSNKPSLSSSKNSGKNNISNVENINQINEEESNINENENSFELINQYTCNIMKNSESIKKLQNQVNKLEKNIMEIIEQLEIEKKAKKKKKKDKKNKMNKIDLNSNNHDISNIGDVSINVPRIIYKELSITKDDL